jgi:hypothetical protein
MRSRARTWLLAGLITGLFGCPAPPASFRVLGLAEAEQVASDHALLLVEAPPVFLRTPVRVSPAIPPGAGVLVYGTDERATRAYAAALARAGNHPVLVFVPRDAEERGRFYAVASPAEEDRRGKDS